MVGRTSASQTAVYGYDPRSGLLTRASEQERTSTYEYSRAGRLKREQWALAGQLYEAFYTYSLGGARAEPGWCRRFAKRTRL